MSHYYYNEPSYPSGGNPWRNPDSEKNHLGNWALGLGIASIFCCGIIFGVTAIVLGLQAQAAADRGEATNRGAGDRWNYFGNHWILRHSHLSFCSDEREWGLARASSPCRGGVAKGLDLRAAWSLLYFSDILSTSSNPIYTERFYEQHGSLPRRSVQSAARGLCPWWIRPSS